jgi:hypothetical protein
MSPSTSAPFSRRFFLLLLLISIGFAAPAAEADEAPTFKLAIKNQQFEPAQLTIPASTRVRGECTETRFKQEPAELRG